MNNLLLYVIAFFLLRNASLLSVFRLLCITLLTFCIKCMLLSPWTSLDRAVGIFYVMGCAEHIQMIYMDLI